MRGGRKKKLSCIELASLYWLGIICRGLDTRQQLIYEIPPGFFQILALLMPLSAAPVRFFADTSCGKLYIYISDAELKAAASSAFVVEKSENPQTMQQRKQKP